MNLPDGSKLLILRNPSSRVELMRSTDDGSRCEAGFEFGLDLRYRLSNFELGYSGKDPDKASVRLGADTLIGDKPRTWVSSEGRTLYSIPGERPILQLPPASRAPVSEVLTRLEAAARTVNEEHGLVLRRPW